MQALVLVLQFISLTSQLTLPDLYCSPPDSSVHGILQVRILERVAMPFSRGSSSPRDWSRVSCGSCIAGSFFTTKPVGKPLFPPLGWKTWTTFRFNKKLFKHLLWVRYYARWFHILPFFQVLLSQFPWH